MSAHMRYVSHKDLRKVYLIIWNGPVKCNKCDQLKTISHPNQTQNHAGHLSFVSLYNICSLIAASKVNLCHFLYGAQGRPSEVTYRTSRALLKILQIMINVTKKLSPEVKNPTDNKTGTHFLFCQLNGMGALCSFVNLLHNNACYMHHGMTVSYFPSLQHFSLWSVIKFHVATNHPSPCF